MTKTTKIYAHSDFQHLVFLRKHTHKWAQTMCSHLDKPICNLNINSVPHNTISILCHNNGHHLILFPHLVPMYSLTLYNQKQGEAILQGMCGQFKLIWDSKITKVNYVTLLHVLNSYVSHIWMDCNPPVCLQQLFDSFPCKGIQRMWNFCSFWSVSAPLFHFQLQQWAAPDKS